MGLWLHLIMYMLGFNVLPKGVWVLKKRKKVDEEGDEMDRIMEEVAIANAAVAASASSTGAGISSHDPPSLSGEMMRQMWDQIKDCYSTCTDLCHHIQLLEG
ncbi:hypothetical protein Ancab_039091 [Ancistrocladus abbreviatus]